MEELLQKLIAKVYELNNTTKHHFFLDFSGHVNAVSVYYYKDGWNIEKECVYFQPMSLYLDNENSAKNDIENLLQELDEFKY